MENNIDNSIIEIKEDDMKDVANKFKEELQDSKEVMALTTKININDGNAILDFGNEPANKIAEFSDRILKSIKTSSVEGSSEMIKQLTSIMKKFDKNDFIEEKQGFFQRLFNSPSKAIEKLMGKYKTIGGEIDTIYTQLTGYKKDINDVNIMLDAMYEENVHYYRELEKYIAAGKIIEHDIEENLLPKLEKKAADSGDQMDIINVENMKNSLELLKQRIYDLEMGKVVSLQTAPQIRIIQKGNYKLVSKIHSAFVVTIPVFKNGIIQAVALKRQKLVADSLSELDKTTNELLIKNAENIKNQSVDIAKLAGSSSVKIETLEQTWNTIMQGIEETKQIEEDNKKNREESLVKIRDMQEQMKEKSIV
ncbi:toxic anion resistance protein [Hathewaya histolytica]|uniref:Toxic anion resistance protein n=1 Tax=Hathewaya histolytica TaxID=1498 RepID=A0A4U9RPF6_HATHI|nr:toxic anion resistance protein [Hathewaya histolytica]VTQ93351.1 toxic anion resistance protein [Hathewaya histolytica]